MSHLLLSIISADPISLMGWVSLAGGLLLLCASAFVSSSETAFFSLTPQNLSFLREETHRNDKAILKLLERPHILLATILITNNFVNITLTLLLANFSTELFDFGGTPVWVEFVVNTIVITFLLLLFGEITPKVFATLRPLSLARFAAPVLQVLCTLCYPFAWLLTHSTTAIEKHMDKVSHSNLSMDELSQAVELTDIATEEEKDILEGITRFGSIQAADIMCPRMDMSAIDITCSFKEVLDQVIESGHSRIPVYEGTNDNICGILFSKDLIPHLDQAADYKWQELLRSAYFVPETKYLDDLLTEFQTNKMHIAIVVNEYGGTAGLVTLEDILEEIIGDISDEYDEEDKQYTRLPDDTFLFEGKILLNDFYKVMEAECDIKSVVFEELFKDYEDAVETLAGLLLEMNEDFLKQGQTITKGRFAFEVIKLDKRRIDTVKVIVSPQNNETAR